MKISVILASLFSLQPLNLVIKDPLSLKIVRHHHLTVICRHGNTQLVGQSLGMPLTYAIS